MKKIILLFLLTLSNFLVAQTWTLQATIGSASFVSAYAINSKICWMVGGSSICWRTTNGGSNWLDSHGNLFTADAYCVYALDANTAWIGGNTGNLYKTSNGGTTWTTITLSPATQTIDGIHFFNANTGFIVGDPPLDSTKWRFWITTNAGLNWSFAANSPTGIIPGEGCAPNCVYIIDTGHIWWTSNWGKVYCGGLKSSFSVNSTNPSSTGIAFQNYTTGVIVHGTGSSPDPNMRTTSGCGSWSTTSFTPPAWPFDIKTAPSTNSSYYWVASGNIVYNTSGYISRSTDNGITFSQQLSLNTPVKCLAMVNVDTGWAGCGDGRIYKYIATDPIGIKEISNTVPENYSLSQNYPNPFNPSTIIDYQLPISTYVKLIVYDLNGREIQKLVNEKQNVGSYSVEFDGINLPSGVYFYKLETDNFTSVKKMVLLK